MLEEIPFTSLASREDNQRIPFELAYKADDCYTDTDAVAGRNGSRSATQLPIGTGLSSAGDWSISRKNNLRDNNAAAVTTLTASWNYSFTNDAFERVDGTGIVSPSGYVYVISHHSSTYLLYSFTNVGALRWKVAIADFAPDTAMPEMISDASDNVYFATGAGFSSYAPDGTRRWHTIDLINNAWQTGMCPALDAATGKLYCTLFTSITNTVHMIVLDSTTGVLQNDYDIGVNGRVGVGTVAMDATDVYFCDSEHAASPGVPSFVAKVSKLGVTAWTITPANGATGTVVLSGTHFFYTYFTAPENFSGLGVLVCALKTDGSTVWDSTAVGIKYSDENTPTVSAAGTGYTPGDILTLVGGTGHKATFKVDTVGGAGDVTGITRVNMGYYTSAPSNPVATTGGTGTGCTITVNFLNANVGANDNEGSVYVSPAIDGSGNVYISGQSQQIAITGGSDTQYTQHLWKLNGTTGALIWDCENTPAGNANGHVTLGSDGYLLWSPWNLFRVNMTTGVIDGASTFTTVRKTPVQAIDAGGLVLMIETGRGSSFGETVKLYAFGAQGTIFGSTPQWLDRFRPDVHSARTVVVLGGAVFVVTDPTTETASDGVVTLLGVPFSDTAIISGAGLNNSYYLSTDQNGVPWVRINWTSPDTYALETLSAIPQGAKPSATVNSSLTWTVFNSITPTVSGLVVQDNSKNGFTQMDSNWRGYSKTDNGNDDPVSGSYAQYKLAAAVDATGDDWVAVAVSPHDSGGIGTQYEVTIQVAVDVAGSPGTFYTIGHIYDIPPVADSPNLVFCDLRTLLAATKSAIRWVKFLLSGSSGGKFISYGYMFLPATPLANPAHFFVDFENVATGEFSSLTEELDVTIPQAIVASYPDSRMGNDIAHSSGGQDDPFSSSNQRVFNPSGSGGPSLQEIGGVITITGTAPTFSAPATLLARLWEDTDNGRRLVTSATVSSGGAYTFVVGGGVSILANQLYRAGGVPPRATSITSKDQRLIAVYQNRRYISSFVPTSDTSNPFPQWPDIALEDDDGWSADFYPNKREQGQVVFGNADALYLVSNESWYYMSDLTPNSPSFRVFGRGALGPGGGKWFEDRFFVASWDGVYEGVSRANPVEMTESVRRIYTDWLVPSSDVCIGYDPSARALFIFEGRKFMRYRFPLENQPGKWTRGTLAQTVKFSAVWNGLVHYGAGTTSVIPQFWLLDSNLFLDRWQANCDRDVMIGTDETTGTSIPSWFYSTGFAATPSPGVVKGLLADPNGNLTATISKTIAAVDPEEARTTTFSVVTHQDELWEPGFGDLKGQKFRVEFTAANTVTLRRAAWERALLDEPKGG